MYRFALYTLLYYGQFFSLTYPINMSYAITTDLAKCPTLRHVSEETRLLQLLQTLRACLS